MTPPTTQWHAGLACRDITPTEPIWLAGYAGRSEPSAGVRQPLHAKALALRDGAGTTAVLVTTDLIGYSARMVAQVRAAVLERHGLTADKLLLAASHSHSSPVTGEQLQALYPTQPEHRVVIDRYTQWVVEQLIQLVGASLAQLSPVELLFEQGLAGFGVNRRRARPGCRHFPGPVDQDVPVLAVRGAGSQLLAVVFGYACHTTTTATQLINGDWAGYAQAAIESANPGAQAMFVAGCGADINPLPRSLEKLPEVYGDILSLAVQEVLRAPMKPLPGGLATAMGTVPLPLQKPPTRADLEKLRDSDAGLWNRIGKSMLDELDRTGALKDHCDYDVVAWKLGGELTWLALAGEVVVDYALRFKGKLGWDNTWVSAYCNEFVTYIPNERVLAEGDYEGRDAMWYFGYSAPFAPGVEELVAGEVERVVGALG